MIERRNEKAKNNPDTFPPLLLDDKQGNTNEDYHWGETETYEIYR